MAELPFLLIGWLLGLLSPRIIDAIRAKYLRRDLAKAIRTEAQDLQCRVVITSFLLVRNRGKVSRDYLKWLKPKLTAYEGNEPVRNILPSVEELLAASDDQLRQIATHMRAEEGMGLNLKRFSSSLIESSLTSIPHFPLEYQRRIHEFRNQLNALNQEIDGAVQCSRMTYDSSITEENHVRLNSNLNSKYQFIQEMCMRVADRLQGVMDFDTKRI